MSSTASWSPRAAAAVDALLPDRVSLCARLRLGTCLAPLRVCALLRAWSGGSLLDLRLLARVFRGATRWRATVCMRRVVWCLRGGAFRRRAGLERAEAIAMSAVRLAGDLAVREPRGLGGMARARRGYRQHRVDAASRHRARGARGRPEANGLLR